MVSVSLTSLWLPIVLSGVVVFLASFVMHMVLPHHRSDFRKMPAEADVMEALRKFNLPPGDYMVPKPDSMADMRSKAFEEKMGRGPVFTTTILPSGHRSMGPQLVQWFVMCLVVSLFAGYLASRSLGTGAPYLRVSQIASTTAFLGYVMAHWGDVIWFKRSTVTALKTTIDGVLYGLLTGGVFGWLWPR
jgi:hypothetical protein